MLGRRGGEGAKEDIGDVGGGGGFTLDFDCDMFLGRSDASSSTPDLFFDLVTRS